MGQLGGWMLREACRHAARLPAVGTHRPRMSVNLSPRQIEPGLVEEVCRAIASAGMDPKLLCLEVTESTLIQRSSAAAVLSELRKVGVRVALDDFGTGYSSLSYLHRFALDVLKIDRSFVSAMESDARTAQIVRTIVQLARNLGFEVVAEGVETSGQAAQLRQLGCDAAQGFLYGAPLRSEELAAAAARVYPVH